MMDEATAGIQIIKEAVEDIQSTLCECIIRGVQITVTEGELRINLPGHGWYTFPETKDRYTLQCQRCKCFNVKIGLNTDICDTCQRELKIEKELDEARAEQHTQWLNDQQDEEREPFSDGCKAFTDESCITPNCKLHSPVVFDCARCDKPQNRCSCE